MPGAGLEWYNDQLYLAGDDSADLLVLDKRWKPRNILPLFHEQKEHTRFTAATLVNQEQSTHLLLAGAGSRAAFDNGGMLMNLQTKAVNELDLHPFYTRVKLAGLSQLHIQAATTVKEHIIFSNHGNRFIITTDACWKDPHQAGITILQVEFPLKKAEHIHITGLHYYAEHDSILFTATNHEESWLGLIENASRKIGRKKMKVNTLVNLHEQDKELKGYLMQALCIQAEKKTGLRLHLTARDGEGRGYLLKIKLKL